MLVGPQLRVGELAELGIRSSMLEVIVVVLDVGCGCVLLCSRLVWLGVFF